MSFFSKALGAVGGLIGNVFGGPIGGALVSGGLDLLGGTQTNNANAAQARSQMDFQAEQNATAYQRAVADLKAAGLNPMLAYTNGPASSGTGAQATMQNAVGHAVNTAMTAKMNYAQVENLREQNKQIKAQTSQAITQSDLNRASTVKAAADAKLAAATAGKVSTDTLLSAAQIPAARNAASAEDSKLGRYGAYWDRLMKSVNKFPILNWFGN